MSTEIVTVILFGGLIILLTLGVPVVFALSSISILVAFMLGGSNDLFIVATTTYRQITDYGLMSIPLFLLMGNFLLHSGISDRLFKALNQWLSGVRGGLAIVSVGVCGLFFFIFVPHWQQRSGSVDVPEVTDLTLEDATLILNTRGFLVTVEIGDWPCTGALTGIIAA